MIKEIYRIRKNDCQSILNILKNIKPCWKLLKLYLQFIKNFSEFRTEL